MHILNFFSISYIAGFGSSLLAQVQHREGGAGPAQLSTFARYTMITYTPTWPLTFVGYNDDHFYAV
jgi:hypothetical protein